MCPVSFWFLTAWTNIYGEQITNASILLFKLLILALILELALHRIFDNRWFIRFLEGRGVKSLIAVLAAYFFVSPFEIDLASDLVGIFENKTLAPNNLGTFITALIIAGGSSTVFRIYRGLNLRPPFSGEGETAIERHDFGRVRFMIKPGNDKNGVKPSSYVEVFANDEWLQTIKLSRELTSPKIGVPLETGEYIFAVGVSPANIGNERWERKLKISRLRNTIVYFDLSKKGNATFS